MWLALSPPKDLHYYYDKWARIFVFTDMTQRNERACARSL
jgi:putative heme degradation protein